MTIPCSSCEYHKSKSNPTQGKLIPNYHGKCSRPTGLCTEMQERSEAFGFDEGEADGTEPALIPELTEENARRDLAVQNTASAIDQAVLDAEGIQEAIGRIKTATFYQKISDVLIAQTFQEIKNSKSYKNYPYIDAEGNRRYVADLEEFCQVKLGKSARRVRELSQNLHTLGPDLYESAERIGFRNKDYRALKALPAEEQEAVKQAMASESKDEVLSILEDLAARHQSEKEAAKREKDDLAADLEARGKLLEDKAKRLATTEEELFKLKSLPPDANLELRLAREEEAVKELDKAFVAALAELNKLMIQVDAIATNEDVAMHTKQYAVQTVQMYCEDMANNLANYGIPVDFEGMANPEWMRDTAKANLEEGRTGSPVSSWERQAMANLGELDTLRGLAHRLEEVGHGQRHSLVKGAAQLLNCSEQTVYRKLKQEIGWASGRKRRKDSGKLGVSQETAKAVAHLMHKSTRANGKRNMKMTDARNMMRDSGFQDADVSTTTLSRAMRQYKCHPDMLAQGKPHVHMRSLHPNHVWQVDPSMCVLFYLPKGGLAVMEESKFYKNKPNYSKDAERERIWRYVITDHYSGTIYVRYVQSAGETAQSLVDVFLNAISVRGLNDPMNGVPKLLIMDKGSANTAHLFTNILDRLQVEWDTHEAGNPRAKGQVECANNIVEMKFESRLAFLNIQTVEELQATADKWQQHFNARAIHSRTGKSRNDVWLTITEEQLRLAPALELCRELVTTKPKEAKIGSDMTITHAIKGYGRNVYDLRQLPGLVPKMKVDVVVNPYRAPAVDVIIHDPSLPEDPVWTVEPKDIDEAGFWKDAPVYGQEYQAQPDTLADKHVKEIDEMAGPDPKHLRAPAGVDVMADIKPAPDYLPRRGRDLGLDASKREIKPYEVVEAALILRNRLGDKWDGKAFAWLQQRYPEGVPVTELDDIAQRLGKQDVTPAPLQLVVNEG